MEIIHRVFNELHWHQFVDSVAKQWADPDEINQIVVFVAKFMLSSMIWPQRRLSNGLFVVVAPS
jgi:hypothetical protein